MSNRFPPAVEETLRAAGWRPDRRDDNQAREWALRVAGYVAPGGQRHVVVPPAIDAYAEFGGLLVTPTGDGEQVAPSIFHLDPMRVLHTTVTLGTLAKVLGSPLTPLGDEGDGTGIIAIDETARLFIVDHTGEWYLGENVDEALTALILGMQPSRLSEDGTW